MSGYLEGRFLREPAFVGSAAMSSHKKKIFVLHKKKIFFLRMKKIILYATIDHYSPLLTTTRHYWPLFATIDHYSPLLTTLRHYTGAYAPLFEL